MVTLLRTAAAALAALAFAVILPASAQAARVALIVGNDAYKNLPALQKARADAAAYADLLKSQGFDQVMLKTDLTKAGLDEAIAVFLDAIKPGDTALFAYSGHGWSDGAQNYILGVDAPKVGSQELLARISVPLRNGSTGVLDDMDRRGAALKVAIIDACRDNPFAPQANGRSIGVGRGLTRLDPPRGTFVVFSAGAGQVALDRLSDRDTDPNSVFTRSFLPQLRAGLPLQEAMQKARAQVVALAGTVRHEQQPAYYDELLGEACLSGRCGDATATTAAVPPATAAQPSAEVAFWTSIQNSSNPADFRAYLTQFPGGTFAALANNRLAALATPTAAAATPAPPAAAPPTQTAALTPPAKVAPPLAPPAPAKTAATTACPGGLVASLGRVGVSLAARCIKVKESIRDCADLCPELVLLPGGSFTMGSPTNEAERRPDENPARTVTIAAGLAVAKYEVTRGEFAAFVRESGYQPGLSCLTLGPGGTPVVAPDKSFRDPGFPQGDNHPVVCVSHDDARAYAAWLAQKTGQPYRLLSEAEFEYAIRAGTKTAYWFGGAEKACLAANSRGPAADILLRRPGQRAAAVAATAAAGCADRFLFTAPVGSYPPNAFGLFDTAGNVAEWTADCYHDSYNGAPKDGTAWVAPGCTDRVLRGGSFIREPSLLRSASRSSAAATTRTGYLGFRVARTLAP
ncbi:MAG: SUMF1/EgtB/PvdO family nonheme iron enzyme [Bauldia sp.]